MPEFCVFVHIFSLSYNLFIGFDDVYYITSSLKKAEREKDLQHKHMWKFICVLWFCQSQPIHRIKVRIGSTFIRAITCIRSEIMAPKSGQLLVSEAAGLFRSLSRLLVSPLCDLSIYVGFANFRNFFETKNLSISFGKKQQDISNSSCFLEGSHFYIFFPIIVQLIRKQLISSCHFYWHAAFSIDYVLCHLTVQNEAWVVTG